MRRTLKCSHCGGRNIQKDDAGFFICAGCGTVLENIRQTERDTEDLLFSYTGGVTGEGGANAHISTGRRVQRAEAQIPQVIREYENEDWDTVQHSGRLLGPTEADYFLAMQKIFSYCIHQVSEEFSLGVSGEAWETEAKKCWLLILDGFVKNDFPVQSIWADSSRHSLRVHPSRVEGLMEGQDIGKAEFLRCPSEIPPDCAEVCSKVTCAAYKEVIKLMGYLKTVWVRDIIGDSPEPGKSPQKRQKIEPVVKDDIDDEPPLAKLKEEVDNLSGEDVSAVPDVSTPGVSTPVVGTTSLSAMTSPSGVGDTASESLTAWDSVKTPKGLSQRKRKYPEYLGLTDREIREVRRNRMKTVPSPWDSIDNQRTLSRNALKVSVTRMERELRDRGLSLIPYHKRTLTLKSAKQVTEKDSFFASIHAIYDHDFLHNLLQAEIAVMKNMTADEVNQDTHIPLILQLMQSSSATALLEAFGHELNNTPNEQWPILMDKLSDVYLKASEHSTGVFRLQSIRTRTDKVLPEEEHADIEGDSHILRMKALAMTVEGHALRRRQRRLADRLVRTRLKGAAPEPIDMDLEHPTSLKELFDLYEAAIKQTQLDVTIIPPDLQLSPFPQALPMAWSSRASGRSPLAPGVAMVTTRNRVTRSETLVETMNALTKSKIEMAVPLLSKMRLDLRILFPLLLLSARLAGLAITGADLLRWSIQGRVHSICYLAKKAGLVPHWLQQAAYRAASSGRLKSATRKEKSGSLGHFSALTPSSALALEEQTARLMEVLGVQRCIPHAFLQRGLVARLLHVLYLPPQMQPYVTGLIHSLKSESRKAIRAKENQPASKLLYLNEDENIFSPETLAGFVLACCRLFFTAFRENEVLLEEVKGEEEDPLRPEWQRSQGVWVELGEALATQCHPKVLTSRLEMVEWLSYDTNASSSDPAIHSMLGIGRFESRFGTIHKTHLIPPVGDVQPEKVVVAERTALFEKAPATKYLSLAFPHSQWRVMFDSKKSIMQPLPSPVLAAMAHRAASFLGRHTRNVLQIVARIEREMSGG